MVTLSRMMDRNDMFFIWSAGYLCTEHRGRWMDCCNNDSRNMWAVVVW